MTSARGCFIDPPATLFLRRFPIRRPECDSEKVVPLAYLQDRWVPRVLQVHPPNAALTASTVAASGRLL